VSTLGGAIAPVAPPCLRAYSELTLTRRACDSDSTKLNRAHHWKSRIYPDPILIQFSLKMIIQIQPVSNKSWILLDKSCPIDDNIQRQVKSLYCAGNKLRGTFDQCSPAVKNTLFRAYCKPMNACQLWSKYTQTSIKRLRAAYNNA